MLLNLLHQALDLRDWAFVFWVLSCMLPGRVILQWLQDPWPPYEVVSGLP